MDTNAKIYIAGHRGMVGSAIVRELERQGYQNLVTRRSSEVDLREQAEVRAFFDQERPDYVFLAAAKVGGIQANNRYRADFIYDNLQIQNNVINEAHRHSVRKLAFLGSSCIYPKYAPQPMQEEHLLTGELEPTNEPYAIAKISGIKLCQAYHDQYGDNFISLMPTNLYGPNDNYDLENSHVLPALIRKFHEAKIQNKPQVEIWGDGSPRREFLHVDDLARAAVHLMNHYDEPGIINIGTGTDVSIAELAERIRRVVGYEGELRYDTSRPNGTPRKLLDISKLKAQGFEPQIDLEEGLRQTYQDFQREFVVS